MQMIQISVGLRINRFAVTRPTPIHLARHQTRQSIAWLPSLSLARARTPSSPLEYCHWRPPTSPSTSACPSGSSHTHTSAMASSLRTSFLPASTTAANATARLTARRRPTLRPASWRSAQVVSRRFQSIQAADATTPRLLAIDPSQLQVTKTTTPKTVAPNDELVFGRTFTDHMLSLEWTATDGWLAPRITPYQNLSLDPATCVLHYAFEAFEGMKAYKDKEGNVRLFRPDKNMARMNKSAARIALPTFDGASFIELIKKFCKMEERFIPS